MFVYLNAWLMSCDFQDVWETAAASFPNSSSVWEAVLVCSAVQNTQSVFHTNPSRFLLKDVFSSSYITYQTWMSTFTLRSLLNFCLCYSLSTPFVWLHLPSSNHAPKVSLPGFLFHLQWKSNMPLPPESPCQDKANRQPLYHCCTAAGFLKEHYA